MHLFSEEFTKFWRQHPALLYACGMLLGIACALNWNIALIVPIGCLTLPFFIHRKHKELVFRFLLTLGLAIGTFSYAKSHYTFPELSPDGSEGQAQIEISSLSKITTHFGKQWVYKGTIQSFTDRNGIIQARNIPYSLKIPYTYKGIHPVADSSYRIHGTLKVNPYGYYTLKADKSRPWVPVEGTWSFADQRFNIKQLLNEYISNHIPNKRSAIFLSGISTGEFDDRIMSFEFGRLGLQHIMAISGFHFAIIAAILSCLLRLFISQKIAIPLLIFLLSSYFLFLGGSASVIRAWISILIVLLGILFHKQGSGLNSLGIGMLVVLLMDPLFIHSIGFQFSFAVTAAILLFYAPADTLLQKFFKKRGLSEAIEMNLINQHGYCMGAFFRKALALTVAVNIIALPMTLYFFHKFPVLSLLYNLFFPFLVSISMLLLIAGFLGALIFPPIGNALHLINSIYTGFVLDFVYNVPPALHSTWRTPDFPAGFLICLLSLLFSAGIYLKQKQEDSLDLIFV